MMLDPKAEPMPLYVSTSPWSWLAYKVGWLFGAGAGKASLEAQRLAERAKQASETERQAWLYRCVLSCGLVSASVASAITLADQGHVAAVGAAALAWIVLVLLPTPTPRIPLFVGRLAAAGTTSALIQIFVEAIPASGASQWKYPMLAAWFAVVLGMLWWAAVGLLRSPSAPLVAVTGNAEGVAVSASGQERWNNVPRTSFADVGGMNSAKEQIRLIASNRFGRPRNGVIQNGILLYGPQGTGKNLLAEATAGEFRVNFHYVRCPELVGQNTGSGAERIRAAFQSAAASRPIVLFLDEVDSIGSRKQVQGYGTDAGGGGREYNSVVTQLMQSIDQYRGMDGLLIVAATNYLDGLEPTLIRDGRFDARIRLDLPSEDERREILAALVGRFGPRAGDLSAVARRTPGWSPARLKALVDRAFVATHGRVIQERDFIAALESTGGRDQDALEPVGWDDVVLPASVIADLRSLLDLMRPGRAEELSLPAPTGLILVGPPGTGKTLVARLIATQAQRSFYAVSPSDVLIGAVGGSVKRLAEIFRRAKENAPSIVFFDEMDGLFPALHGRLNQHDVQLVEQALIEISALKPEHLVFLIGTTNYLDRIDVRVLRGGRFSEKIAIPVPDEAGYVTLIARYLGKARLDAGFTVTALARRVAGMAPADLEATVQGMKRIAMRRMAPDASELPPLRLDDLEEAIGRVQPRL